MLDVSVYTILIALGFLLSIVLSLVLVFSENIFIVLIALYIIGTSIYTYVYFARNPSQKHDINYNVNKYITLFNISLSGFLLILMIFKYSFRFSNNTVDTYSSYRR